MSNDYASADRIDSTNRTDSTDEVGPVFDIVVIGGGPAGLAIGRYVSRQSRQLLVPEADLSIANGRRLRRDVLRLIQTLRVLLRS